MREKKPSAADLVTETEQRLDVRWMYLADYEQTGDGWEGN